MTTWIEGPNGNKCSAEYFGSAEAAQKALADMKRMAELEAEIA